MRKVLIGLNSYNDLPLLRETLPVLEELRVNLSADLVVLDTAHNDEVRSFIEDTFPDATYLRHQDGNIGYGRSYNEILRANPGHKYFLLVTSDVLLNPAVVEAFVDRMEKDPSIAMCSGKLHHWDAKNHRKTKYIDSLGIVAEKRHHFYDRGHGELDSGQYDEELPNIFGLTGAVLLIRTSVIPKLHGSEWQLIDERIWMYKEDIDLSYRLRWLGEKIVLFPEVWGWHGRTISNKEGKSLRSLSKADQQKRGYARLHSYKNHILLLKNNFSWKYGASVLFRTLCYEILKGTYILVMHPLVFFAGLKTLIVEPGRSSTRKTSPKKMLSYFQ